MKKSILIALLTGLPFLGLMANNLNISGTIVTGSAITFNISWENSWYLSTAPANWDGVWVFVKYQDCTTKVWSHANLSVNSGDHSAASPLTVDAVTDGKGVFIRRASFGTGNIANTSVTLTMNIPAGTYNYRVYGIEMVNIPAGDFQLGGASSNSTNSISITSTSQSGGLSAGAVYTSSTLLPSSYPMGVNAFWCMKYEITQQQYVDFLNTLNYFQQTQRAGIDPSLSAGSYVFNSSSARNGMKIMTPSTVADPAVFGNDLSGSIFNGSNDGQGIACAMMAYSDILAYLDWSALRPMTELEYEKICRGPSPRISNEYPWGSTAFNYPGTSTITSSGTATETFQGVGSNGFCITGNFVSGPARVGSCATTGTGRASAGASYYGALDMAGNVEEFCVSAVSAQAVNYTTACGDGNVNGNGDSDVSTWPNITSIYVNRGGSWNSSNNGSQQTSSRYSAINTSTSSRNTYNGGRGVR